MPFLSHIHLGISDIERSRRFYEPIMRELGLVVRDLAIERSWMSWGERDGRRPFFMIGLPYDRGAADAGNGTMCAFLANRRAVVDRCYSLALSLGGTDEGPPGLRTWYHPEYYGTYFRDPDENKICVVCHEPEGI